MHSTSRSRPSPFPSVIHTQTRFEAIPYTGTFRSFQAPTTPSPSPSPSRARPTSGATTVKDAHQSRLRLCHDRLTASISSYQTATHARENKFHHIHRCMEHMITTCFHVMNEIGEMLKDEMGKNIMSMMINIMERAIYNPHTIHQLLEKRCPSFILSYDMSSHDTPSQPYSRTHAAQVDILIEQRQNDMYTIQLLNTKVDKWMTQYQTLSSQYEQSKIDLEEVEKKHHIPTPIQSNDDTDTALYRADLLRHHLEKQIRELQAKLENVSQQLVTRDQAYVENAQPKIIIQDTESQSEYKNLWNKYQEALEQKDKIASELQSTNIILRSYRQRFQKSARHENTQTQLIASLRARITELETLEAERMKPMTRRPSWSEYDDLIKSLEPVVIEATEPVMTKDETDLAEHEKRLNEAHPETSVTTVESTSQPTATSLTVNNQPLTSLTAPTSPTSLSTSASTSSLLSTATAPPDMLTSNHPTDTNTDTNSTTPPSTTDPTTSTKTDTTTPTDASTSPSISTITRLAHVMSILQRVVNEKQEMETKLTNELNQVKMELKEVQERWSLSDMYKDSKLDDDPRPTEAGTRAKFFIGLGTDPEIPLYLRIHGKVRNRNLSKGECEHMVKQIWHAKMEYNKDPKMKPTHLSEFLYQFLKKKFGIHALIVEWGYSMIAALQRYSWDADCELFLKVLHDELCESVYIDQMEMLNKMYMMAQEIDYYLHGKMFGRCDRDLFVFTLKNLFPNKSSKEIALLAKAIDADQPGAIVRYHALMGENEQGDQGKFMELIRDRHLFEIEDFMITLQDRVIHMEHDEDEMIRLSDVKKAWCEVDKNVDMNYVDKCIARTMDMELEHLDWEMQIKDKPFFQRLFSLNLVKRTLNWDPHAKIYVDGRKEHAKSLKHWNSNPNTSEPLSFWITSQLRHDEFNAYLQETRPDHQPSVARRASVRNNANAKPQHEAPTRDDESLKPVQPTKQRTTPRSPAPQRSETAPASDQAALTQRPARTIRKASHRASLDPSSLTSTVDGSAASPLSISPRVRAPSAKSGFGSSTSRPHFPV